jgi:hypothetical protein
MLDIEDDVLFTNHECVPIETIKYISINYGHYDSDISEYTDSKIEFHLEGGHYVYLYTDEVLEDSKKLLKEVSKQIFTKTLKIK